MVFHVLNRGVGRMRLFYKDADYEAFERNLEKTLETCPMRICGYTLMPNHWHLVLWPEKAGELGDFMQKLTVTHVRNWQEHRRKVGMGHVLQQAHAFQGTAFVEIFQNCIVYNEDVFASFTDRRDAANTQLHLRHGEPMLFGDNKGIRFNQDSWSLEVIDAQQSPDEVLVHDEGNAILARLLVDLHLPVAMGVIYRQPAQTYEDAFYAHHPSRMRRVKKTRDFIKGPSSWSIDDGKGKA